MACPHSTHIYIIFLIYAALTSHTQATCALPGWNAGAHGNNSASVEMKGKGTDTRKSEHGAFTKGSQSCERNSKGESNGALSGAF